MPKGQRSLRRSWAKILSTVAIVFFTSGVTGWIDHGIGHLRSNLFTAIGVAAAFFAAPASLRSEIRNRSRRSVQCATVVLAAATFSTDSPRHRRGVNPFDWTSQPERIVVVEPRDISLRHTGFSRTTRIVVKNVDDRITVYSVWIKLWTETAGVRADSFQIRGDVDESAPLVPIPTALSATLDGFGLYGSDYLGREAVMFQIYKLAPGAERTFDVSSTTLLNASAFAQVIGLTKSPVTLFSSENRVTKEGATIGMEYLQPEHLRHRRGIWSLQRGFLPNELIGMGIPELATSPR